MNVAIKWKLREMVVSRPKLFLNVLRLTPDVPVEVNDAAVGPMRIRLRRHRAIWLHGALQRDRGTMLFFRTFVRPGAVVYDVGANIGQVARYVAQETPAAHVYAFEPMPDNVVDLCENVRRARSGAVPITVVPCALSDRRGLTELQVDDFMSQSAALSVVTGGRASEGRGRHGLAPLAADVITMRMDDLGDLGLPQPDVIKIDVEGAEALVLAGAQRTLERNVALYVELHGERPQRETLQLLGERGFKLAGAPSTNATPSYVDASTGRLEYVVATRDADALARFMAQGPSS